MFDSKTRFAQDKRRVPSFLLQFVGQLRFKSPTPKESQANQTSILSDISFRTSGITLAVPGSRLIDFFAPDHRLHRGGDERPAACKEQLYAGLRSRLDYGK